MQESDSAVFSTQAATLNPSKNRYRDILPCKYRNNFLSKLVIKVMVWWLGAYTSCSGNLFDSTVKKNEVSWRRGNFWRAPAIADWTIRSWTLKFIYDDVEKSSTGQYLFMYLFLFTGDHTRVTLNTKEGGDYINANVIKVRIAWSSHRKELSFSIVSVAGSAFPFTIDNSKCVYIVKRTSVLATPFWRR